MIDHRPPVDYLFDDSEHDSEDDDEDEDDDYEEESSTATIVRSPSQQQLKRPLSRSQQQGGEEETADDPTSLGRSPTKLMKSGPTTRGVVVVTSRRKKRPIPSPTNDPDEQPPPPPPLPDAYASILFQTIMDNAKCCHKRNVLAFLDVRDLARSQLINRDFHFWAEREISRRGRLWKEGTSVAWDVPGMREGGRRCLRSADELSNRFTVAAGVLDEDWRELVPTVSDLYETIAGWCGGWARLLHARETRARPQPQPQPPVVRDDSRPANDNGSGTVPPQLPPSALIFDLHCNGRHRWSGIRPLRREDVTTSANGHGRAAAATSTSTIFPFSTFTLGHQTDGGFFGDYTGDRPTQYLLTMYPQDRRTWRLSVSLVSVRGCETLIHSVAFRIDKVLRDLHRGGHLSEVTGLHDEPFYVGEERGDHRLAKCYADGNDGPDACTPFVEEDLVGIGSIDGLPKHFGRVCFNKCFWFDGREKRDRVHMMADLVCDSALLTDMVMNPPPPPPPKPATQDCGPGVESPELTN